MKALVVNSIWLNRIWSMTYVLVESFPFFMDNWRLKFHQNSPSLLKLTDHSIVHFWRKFSLRFWTNIWNVITNDRWTRYLNNIITSSVSINVLCLLFKRKYYHFRRRKNLIDAQMKQLFRKKKPLVSIRYLISW